ncbi:MAG: hypothetical protein ACP5PP_01570 [Fervidobacterium sp.]|jgi:glutamate 5-kinase
MASESGVDTYIINGKKLENVMKVLNGENPGTKFILPHQKGFPRSSLGKNI